MSRTVNDDIHREFAMNSDDVKVTRPVQDVVLLEHTDPRARRVNIATNTYVLLNAARQAIVIDGSFDYLLSPIQDILDQGYRLAGVALTHRHLTEHGALLNRVVRTLDVPILLHPRDAGMLRSLTTGLAFQDPTGHFLPRAFGVETVFFPGHTEGHVMYYRAADGLLMTGDAAMSTTRAQTAEDMTRLFGRRSLSTPTTPSFGEDGRNSTDPCGTCCRFTARSLQTAVPKTCVQS
jgi:glyoxylase-like metal-dependent hydrolase (beta-lactamase superfamily II)